MLTTALPTVPVPGDAGNLRAKDLDFTVPPEFEAMQQVAVNPPKISDTALFQTAGLVGAAIKPINPVRPIQPIQPVVVNPVRPIQPVVVQPAAVNLPQPIVIQPTMVNPPQVVAVKPQPAVVNPVRPVQPVIVRPAQPAVIQPIINPVKPIQPLVNPAQPIRTIQPSVIYATQPIQPVSVSVSPPVITQPIPSTTVPVTAQPIRVIGAGQPTRIAPVIPNRVTAPSVQPIIRAVPSNLIGTINPIRNPTVRPVQPLQTLIQPSLSRFPSRRYGDIPERPMTVKPNPKPPSAGVSRIKLPNTQTQYSLQSQGKSLENLPTVTTKSPVTDIKKILEVIDWARMAATVNGQVPGGPRVYTQAELTNFARKLGIIGQLGDKRTTANKIYDVAEANGYTSE